MLSMPIGRSKGAAPSLTPRHLLAHGGSAHAYFLLQSSYLLPPASCLLPPILHLNVHGAANCMEHMCMGQLTAWSTCAWGS